MFVYYWFFGIIYDSVRVVRFGRVVGQPGARGFYKRQRRKK
jgi:hypothetical protein